MMFLPSAIQLEVCANSDTFYLLDAALFMPNITSTVEISFPFRFSPVISTLRSRTSTSIYIHFRRARCDGKCARLSLSLSLIMSRENGDNIWLKESMHHHDFLKLSLCYLSLATHRIKNWKTFRDGKIFRRWKIHKNISRVAVWGVSESRITHFSFFINFASHLPAASNFTFASRVLLMTSRYKTFRHVTMIFSRFDC